jgi:nucleoside-diphosphate-sugar epimerase
MTTVLVTGAAGWLGRRVMAALAAERDVTRIVAVDAATVPILDVKVEPHRHDVRREIPPALMEGIDTVIHLAFTGEDGGGRRGDGDGTANVLAAASAGGVDHIVLLSSAVVYGAWPNNPRPLTEDAALRPNSELPVAVQRAHSELLLAAWRAERESRVASVLRPCPVLGPDGSSVMARSLATAAGMRRIEEEPPRQFVHPDDLATAVDVVRRARLDGPFNVAPDGWIAGDMVRELAGVAPRPALPSPLARRLARLRWRLQRGPIPPGLIPYTEYPWLVANDRLKAAGWTWRYTNEQAYVAGTEARWWTTLSPKRKQELALGGAGVLAVAVVGGAAVVVQRVVRAARTRRRA